MKLLTWNPIITLIVLSVVKISALSAQTKGVVVDENTYLPIAYVNIHSSDGYNVRGTTCDENGEFDINFDFRNLVFSHINYNQISVEKAEMHDTIFLTPASILLREVVVSNIRPDWIEKKLKSFVKLKSENYRTEAKNFAYRYDSYTLSDSSGYAFQSSGDLHIPPLTKNERCFIDAKTNVVKYKDGSAGTDFSSLQRILYDDFIAKFDDKFIRDYSFSQYPAFENEDENLVPLLFTNKKYKDVSGYIILDTLNNVIVEFERNSGTEYNVKTQTNGILRNYVAAWGASYHLLETKVKTSYKKSGNSYYLSESKYKSTQKIVSENKKHKWTNFHAAEAQLVVGEETQADTDKMIVVPKHWYMAIYTKKIQREDAALQNVPKRFERF